MYFSEISQHFNISQSRKKVKSFVSNLLIGHKEALTFWICMHTLVLTQKSSRILFFK